MAINLAPQAQAAEPQIRDYWKRYYRNAMLATVAMEIAVTLVIGLSLVFGGMSPSSLGYWVAILATFVTTSVLNYFMVDFLLIPLRDVTMAITSAAGQKPTSPLANPNAPRYSKNGFKPVLQFIYEHAAAESTLLQTYSTGDPQKLEQLEAAFHHTTTGVVIMDTKGRIHYTNEAAPILTDSLDTPQLELLFEQQDTLTNWLAECQKNAVHAEQTWLRVPNRLVGDEERRVFNVTANYEKGSAAEVILTTFDMTSVYQPEDDELDFISFAAHELRGPITVIRGYIDVLSMELEKELSDDQKELFNRLVVSANRLSGYINNILNTSKFDRRHLKVHLAKESLASIYDSTRDDMDLRASSQHRLLSVDIPSDLPDVAADRSSLSEVFSNLIDNAIKYSNEGGAIAVSARNEGEFVKISVQDHGIGIPSSVIGNLFHKFYRSHRSRETVAGSGIGLYISKAIIESHGGRIGVISKEGSGATFSFTIPTFASVADKLQANDFTNAGLISSSEGWIRNHSKFTG